MMFKIKRKLRLRFVVCIACLAIYNTYSFGQEIDYAHKTIYKELSRLQNNSEPNLIELNIPDSIVDSIHLKGKYFSVQNNSEQSPLNYIYIGRVNCCRAGGCSLAPNTVKENDSEYFDYFILLDKKATVEQVKVFNYQATHGHEITAIGWLKQFNGYNGSRSLEVGSDIDAISGATISVYAVTYDIQDKTDLLKKIIAD